MKRKIYAMLGIGTLIPILIMLMVTTTALAVLGAVIGADQAQKQYYNGGGGGLSAEVFSYQSIIDDYCNQYGIPEYSQLIMAIMQLESGGTGTDPMQCSECPLNTKYSNTPGAISDPKYSIDIGIQYFASCLRAAKCESPEDIPHISLALQGYNYGGGYINWAIDKGGYTPANAKEFSQMKAQQMGMTGYGDVNYVSDVLKYYQSSMPVGDAVFNYPIYSGLYTFTSGFGMREGKLHKGIDLAAPQGTRIYAAQAGTVIFSGFGNHGKYHGYGNVVVIKHDDTFSTLYAHCSELFVSNGESIMKGEPIGLVGSTGDSTGNHCHFEIRVHDKATNPLPYLKIKN